MLGNAYLLICGWCVGMGSVCVNTSHDDDVNYYYSIDYSNAVIRSSKAAGSTHVRNDLKTGQMYVHPGAIHPSASQRLTALLHHQPDTDENSYTTTKVLHHVPYNQLTKDLDLRITRQPSTIESILSTIDQTLEYSVRTGHPLFLDKLYAGVTPIGVCGELLTSALNINTHVYQVSPVGTLMESVCLNEIRALIGYVNGSGIMCAGGSMSNLVAMVTARNLMFPHMKVSGMSSCDRPLAVFTSTHSHFSLDKCAMVLGIGLRFVFKVRTAPNGCMMPDDLEMQIKDAISKGFRPFFINATAGTTVLCSFDPLRPISRIAKQYNMWLHVDGSWGGSVLFSTRHKHLLDGIEQSDSFVVNPHKLLGVPLQCSCLVVNRPSMSDANSVDAQYLYHTDSSSDGGADIGDSGIGCGRRADGVKLYLSWKFEGTCGFEARVDHAFELAAVFRACLRTRYPRFVPVLEAGLEHGMTVCFWYVPFVWRPLVVPESTRWYASVSRHVTLFTKALRSRLVERGNVLVDYAPFPHACGETGPDFFRVPIHSLAISEAHLRCVLDEMELVGALVARELALV